MKIKKLVKLAPMMLLTFLLGLSGCSGSTSADARVNDHPNEADEELHVLTIGTADRAEPCTRLAVPSPLF